jgi:hypothetical protein
MSRNLGRRGLLFLELTADVYGLGPFSEDREGTGPAIRGGGAGPAPDGIGDRASERCTWPISQQASGALDPQDDASSVADSRPGYHVREDAEAVLIIGAYLTGKSSVAAEIADILEDRGIFYALLDLDYLGWADAPGYDGHGDDPWLFVANLRAVTDNYGAADVKRFLVAGYVSDHPSLDAIVGVLDMPTRVVRLEIPLEEIARRADADPTSGRADDFRESQGQVGSQASKELEGAIVRNDRPIRETAFEILDLLGWL